MRDIPIMTFINKMDREARNPFDLLDEIEKTLALDTAPSPGRSARAGASPAPTTSPQSRAPHRHGRGADRGLRARRRRRAGAAAAGRSRGLAGRGRAGAGGLQALRPRGVPRGPPDPGLLRQRAAQFRRARSHRRAGGLCAAAPRPGGRQAHRGGGRGQDDRLRVQDPGQHGPEPPRPHRLHAHLLGQAPARHEGEARAHRQADEPQRAAILLRAGPRHRRRGLCRRRGRHPQPRHAEDRRHADRGRGHGASAACRTSRRKSCAASSCRTP